MVAVIIGRPSNGISTSTTKPSFNFKTKQTLNFLAHFLFTAMNELH